MREITDKSGIGVCDACFSGNYPAPVPKENYVDKFSKKISLEK
jgi:glutamine phosphoribosylpyrophosphate amidotransferase